MMMIGMNDDDADSIVIMMIGMNDDDVDCIP